MQTEQLILVTAFIATALLTIVFKELFQRFKGNLYSEVRGGTPRAVGIAPFLVLALIFPPPGNYLIIIMGLFAFFDDLIGRKKIRGSAVEFGQLSRGVGMLLVMVVGYFYFGPVSILIALMIQPMNIADMQPGSACTTVVVMCLLVLLGLLTLNSTAYYSALLILVVCLGYAPMDYMGKIMMGEVGNHTFAVGLGIIFASLGVIIGNSVGGGGVTTFLFTLIMLLLTTVLIAFIRRRNLEEFLENKLSIENPVFGDYFMDVLTGGGLGDIVRKVIFKRRIYPVNNRLLISLGFRRLLYNPHAER